MNTKKAGGKSIGEVEKLTGIPRRKLKYFIERDLFRPSLRGENGYWLYTEADIQKLWTVFLYHELGYPDSTVRVMRDGSGPVRQTELDRHIQRLSGKQRETENLLLAAEYVRYRQQSSRSEQAFVIDDFDRHISAFVHGSPADTAEGADVVQKRDGMKQELCESFLHTLSELYDDKTAWEELRFALDLSPAAPEAQEQIKVLCDTFRRAKGLSPEDVLFEIRLVRDFSYMALLLDTLLEKVGATDHLVNAVQLYCDKINMEVLV